MHVKGSSSGGTWSDILEFVWRSWGIQRNPHNSHSSGQDLNLGLRAQQMFEIGMGASDRYIYRWISIWICIYCMMIVPYGDVNCYSMELRNNAVSDAILSQINPFRCGFHTHAKCPSPIRAALLLYWSALSSCDVTRATLHKARGQDAISFGICGKRVWLVLNSCTFPALKSFVLWEKLLKFWVCSRSVLLSSHSNSDCC